MAVLIRISRLNKIMVLLHETTSITLERHDFVRFHYVAYLFSYLLSIKRKTFLNKESCLLKIFVGCLDGWVSRVLVYLPS